MEGIGSVGGSTSVALTMVLPHKAENDLKVPNWSQKSGADAVEKAAVGGSTAVDLTMVP